MGVAKFHLMQQEVRPQLRYAAAERVVRSQPIKPESACIDMACDSLF
jgi:hypothetical protein